MLDALGFMHNQIIEDKHIARLKGGQQNVFNERQEYTGLVCETYERCDLN